MHLQGGEIVRNFCLGIIHSTIMSDKVQLSKGKPTLLACFAISVVAPEIDKLRVCGNPMIPVSLTKPLRYDDRCQEGSKCSFQYRVN